MKKERNKFLKYASMFMIAVTLVVCSNVKNITAQAAYASAVTNVAQQGLETTSIQLSWTPGKDATSYRVYFKSEKDYNSDYAVMDAQSQTGCTISGLQPGEKYDIKIESYNGANSGSIKYFDGVTKIDQLNGLKQTKWWYFSKILNVEWTKSSAAEGYEVVLYDDKNKKVKQLTETSGFSSFYKMKDKVYTVKVRAYMTYGGQKYYTPWSSIKCLNQARISSVKVSGSKLNLKWGKVSGATGYNIYVSTKKNSGYKKVATASKNKTSYSVKKLKGKKFSAKKIYYVYIETVCNTKTSKNTSGAIYYWNSKNGNYGYISK